MKWRYLSGIFLVVLLLGAAMHGVHRSRRSTADAAPQISLFGNPGWSSPVNVSNNSGWSAAPSIAVDSGGTLHVLWRDNTPGNYEIFYASKAPGGSWTTPVNISNASGDSGTPDIAVDSSDQLHGVWDDTGGILYATKPPGGSWSTPVDIGWGYGGQPSIAIDSSDTVHVAWNDYHPEDWDWWEILYQSKPSGGSWTWPEVVSDSTQDCYRPKITVDNQDAIHVVWWEGETGDGEVFYGTRSGPWVWNPINLSDNAGWSMFPVIAVDSGGTVDVMWNDATPGNFEILYTNKPSGGSWSAPANVSNNSGGSIAPATVVDNRNALQMVWYDSTPGNSEILYASKPLGGSWSTSSNISNNSGSSSWPAVTVDGANNLHVVWSDDTPGNYEIFYSVLELSKIYLPLILKNY